MWLFGVARRVLSGQRRSFARRAALSSRLASELAATINTSHDETHDEVRAAIDGLAERDAEIIRLVYWEGFSLTEAAEILGMKAGTVRTRHARARQTLKAALTEQLP